jgi:hypothetical protein
MMPEPRGDAPLRNRFENLTRFYRAGDIEFEVYAYNITFRSIDELGGTLEESVEMVPDDLLGQYCEYLSSTVSDHSCCGTLFGAKRLCDFQW